MTARDEGSIDLYGGRAACWLLLLAALGCGAKDGKGDAVSGGSSLGGSGSTAATQGTGAGSGSNAIGDLGSDSTTSTSDVGATSTSGDSTNSTLGSGGGTSSASGGGAGFGPGTGSAAEAAEKLGREPNFLIGMGNDLAEDHDEDGAYTLGVRRPLILG